MNKINELVKQCIPPIVFETVVNDDLPTLEVLLVEFNLSPNERYLGRTPLHHACGVGNLPMVKLLIKYGADIDALEVGNYSPLEVALHNNKTEVVKYLVTQSQYLIVHSDYMGSIFNAIIYDNYEIYLVLKKLGVDLKNAGDKDITALAMSVVGPSKKILNDLLGELEKLDIKKEIDIFEKMFKTEKLSPHRRALRADELETVKLVLEKLKAYPVESC